MTSQRAQKFAARPTQASRWRTVVSGAAILVCGLVALRPPEVHAQGANSGSLELVDPNVFRACGDPRNMPFSNDKGEGFENKLAELFAAKLGKKLSYTYFPQATGFVRMTLGSYRCDVIIGFPQGDDQAQVTIPYYRTTYALVTKRGSGLEDVTTIDDARLKDNLARGEIDCGILWGPMAGYYAGKADPPLVVVPLLKEKTGPQMTFRIGMGVRPSDQEWKRTLSRLIKENQAEINKLLISYNVPILDESDMAITAETLSKQP
jgi:hypothetical protein